MIIASKRREMKEIAKISFGLCVFNINEPVIFGMPIILNPILAIPFIIMPLVTSTIGYFAKSIGFADKACGHSALYYAAYH
ncbi:MAG: PTS transporter subunit EIIC [Candidatus Malihini olakiniferum]